MRIRKEKSPNLQLAVEAYKTRKSYPNKTTVTRILADYGLSRTELYRELRKQDLLEQAPMAPEYEANLAEAVNLYKDKCINNMTMLGITTKCGVSVHDLYTELEKLELIGSYMTKSEHTEMKEYAIELYKNRKMNKLTIAEISLETGIATSTLYLEINNRGINDKKRKVKRNSCKEAVSLYKNMASNDMTVKEIAKVTGLAPSTVYRHAQKDIEFSRL